MTKHRSTKQGSGRGRDHNIVVRGVQKDSPDLRSLARVAIALALEEKKKAESEAAKESPTEPEEPPK